MSGVNHEELHPDLKAAMSSLSAFGSMILHPLCIEYFYTPDKNTLLNARYGARKAEVERALKAGDLASYIKTHERPYRLTAFQAIKTRMHSAQYWELLALIWLETESLWDNFSEWKDLLSALVPGSHHFMDEKERAALAALPNQITIYRGYLREPNGLSYTLSLDKAREYAAKFAPQGKVKNRNVRKEDVFALILRRSEQEIILRPHSLSLMD